MDILRPDSPDNNPQKQCTACGRVHRDFRNYHRTLPTQKQCTGPCGRVLPATDEFFYRGKGGYLTPRCKTCIEASNRKKREDLREKQRERDKQKEQESQLAESYVYGILKKEQLVYVGRGKGKRVYESLRDHHGTSYFFFAQEMTYNASVDLENDLLIALKEKLENGAGARNRNAARNEILLWFEEKGYLEEDEV